MLIQLVQLAAAAYLLSLGIALVFAQGKGFSQVNKIWKKMIKKVLRTFLKIIANFFKLAADQFK